MPAQGRRNTCCTGLPGGFSLFELVLVLIIVSLTAALVTVRMGAGWKRTGEREFLSDMVLTLKRARLRALSTGEVAFFRIRGEARRYGIELPPRQSIPENVDIYSDKLERDEDTGDRLLVFYPDGSVADNDLKIVFDRERAYHILVHPITGLIRLTKAGS
jgi:general secretion pathway protein H